jgi:hypothetical protein
VNQVECRTKKHFVSCLYINTNSSSLKQGPMTDFFVKTVINLRVP